MIPRRFSIRSCATYANVSVTITKDVPRTRSETQPRPAPRMPVRIPMNGALTKTGIPEWTTSSPAAYDPSPKNPTVPSDT